MSISPVKFATAFERLRNQLGAIQSESARLQLLMTFWPEIKAVEGNQTFSGFVEEYGRLLAMALTAAAIADLDADGLAQLESQIADLRAVDIGADKIAAVKLGRARLLLYLGETEAGVAAVARAADLQYEPSEHCAGGRLRDEFERFEQAYNALPETDLKRHLQPILEDWQARREAVHHDRAVCVFVAKGAAEGSSDGRLRVLRARVEPASKAAPGDQVTFDNQIRTPQDPFVGSAYAALAAVRGYLDEAGYSSRAKGHLNAHFTVEDSGETFTGDSIGLAIALLTYTQLLQLEVERQDRFLSAEAAYTGAVSSEGEILPVSEESIGAKVKRVFHSPVRFLVMPQANYPAARAALEQLEAAYPRRNLTLIPVRHLADCLNDHNVVRSQKVCIGEYMARRAARYSRTTAVQVAMLGVVGYLLLCLMYPKAWVGFDWEPASVRVKGNSFVGVNKSGKEVLQYKSNCDPIDSNSAWAVADLVGNAEAEVLLIPLRVHGRECIVTHRTHDYNRLIGLTRSGSFLFAQDCVGLDEYPGDTSLNQPYSASSPIVLDLGGRKVIMTSVSRSDPARSHFRFFDQLGNLLGWFIEAGAMFHPKLSLAVDRRGNVVIISYNNRYGAASLFVLNPDSCRGVAPPYDLPFHKAYTEGKQEAYFVFPKTDLNRTLNVDYNYSYRVQIESDGSLRVEIDESRGEKALVIYRLDQDYELIDADPSDHFVTMRDSFVDRGILPSVEPEEYKAQLMQAVRRWDHGNFEPAVAFYKN